jgi:hypothetical protein
MFSQHPINNVKEHITRNPKTGSPAKTILRQSFPLHSREEHHQNDQMSADKGKL